MPPRSKQTITLEELKELGKALLPEPNVNYYLSDDVNVVVTQHLCFFLKVAEKTRRLNAVSIALISKDLFQLQKRESDLYGEGLASAFGHCMMTGGKATTGVKLSEEVRAVYNASLKAGLQADLKQEKGLKREVKGEVESPPRPAKALKPCLSSPSQIAALYAGSSSSHVKVTIETTRRHRRTCLLDICASIHTEEAQPNASFMCPHTYKIFIPGRAKGRGCGATAGEEAEGGDRNKKWSLCMDQ